MFVYKEWEKFCSKIHNLNLNCITAFEALEASKSSIHYTIIKHDVETNIEKALQLAIIENKYQIKSTIKRFEPIVVLQNILIEDEAESNRYRIQIQFRIKEFDIDDSVEIVLRRLR